MCSFTGTKSFIELKLLVGLSFSKPVLTPGRDFRFGLWLESCLQPMSDTGVFNTFRSYRADFSFLLAATNTVVRHRDKGCSITGSTLWRCICQQQPTDDSRLHRGEKKADVLQSNATNITVIRFTISPKWEVIAILKIRSWLDGGDGGVILHPLPSF
jgi:hypothetical protein